MADEIIKELWEIKDTIARECGYDIDALMKYLQTRKTDPKRQVVDPRTLKKSPQPGPPKDKARE
ncbi:MAG TPA: hypothetical protein VM658_02250 [bacterium]|nr:hypothetical protein [bacterium]